MSKPGHRKLKRDAFDTHPELLQRHIRDWVLDEAIPKGLTPIQEEGGLIDHFEYIAVAILQNEPLAFNDGAPEYFKDRDGSRLWWVNEAFHLSRHNGEVPEAHECLAPAPHHAVNVLTAANALRAAMEAGNVEKVAALSMLLVLDVIQGGYSLELEPAKAARDKALRNGIGKQNSIYAELNRYCVKRADEIWAKSPTKRIGEVIQEILDALFKVKAEKKQDLMIPTDDKIKDWLKKAQKQGQLEIPPGACRGGRSKKKCPTAQR